MDAETGIVTTVAGNGEQDFAGEDGPALAASFRSPHAVAVDSVGNVFFSAQMYILQVEAATGLLRRIAGNGDNGQGIVDGIPARDIDLNTAFGLVIDEAGGNIFFSDWLNHAIRRIDTRTLLVDTVAGTGNRGFADNRDPRQALFNDPRGIAIAPDGTLYVADRRNDRIRRIAPDGTVSTFAGGGATFDVATDLPATSVGLNSPLDIALHDGVVFFADGIHIHSIDPDDNILRRVAGVNSTGFSGDGGPAVQAEISAGFASLSVDGSGNVLLGDGMNYRIRRISAQSGIIKTVVGNGKPFILGDGEPAIGATLRSPTSIIMAPDGGYFIADSSGARVRRINGETGQVSTVPGIGALDEGNRSDGALATQSLLFLPNDLALDSNESLFH